MYMDINHFILLRFPFFHTKFVSGLTPATSQLITSYTDQLLKDGLLTRILNLLDQISVSDELARLARGRAVGDAQHKRQIVEMIREQRSCLADCLFLWVVQTPFATDECLEIVKHVKKMKISGEEVPAANSNGGAGGGQSSTSAAAPAASGMVGKATVDKVTVDTVTVSLCMTVMACFNIGEDSVEQSDDSLTHDQYPLLSDSSLLPAVHGELTNVRGR